MEVEVEVEVEAPVEVEATPVVEVEAPVEAGGGRGGAGGGGAPPPVTAYDVLDTLSEDTSTASNAEPGTPRRAFRSPLFQLGSGTRS